MKIGIFTDVHNNVFALKAVLEKLNEEGCEEFICCGDLNGIGPCPQETIELAASLEKLHCVVGNHETYVLKGLDPIPDGMGEGEALLHKWEWELLTASERTFIQQLPEALEIEREGVKIAILHYSMLKNGRYANYIPSPTPTDCETLFSGIDADVICYGHDHKDSTVKTKTKLYINSGSLGCPGTLGGKARAGVLTVKNKTFAYEPITVNYDLSEVIEKIDLIRYPDYEIVKKIFYGID